MNAFTLVALFHFRDQISFLLKQVELICTIYNFRRMKDLDIKNVVADIMGDINICGDIRFIFPVLTFKHRKATLFA